MSILMQNGHAIGGGATLASELTVVDTEGLVGTAGSLCTAQQLFDVLSSDSEEAQPSYDADSSAWDTTPTQSSTKPITSGGVYSYIDSMITQAVTDSY